MSISEEDAPARSRLYFANSSGCALSADSRWRSSLSPLSHCTFSHIRDGSVENTVAASAGSGTQLDIESLETGYLQIRVPAGHAALDLRRVDLRSGVIRGAYAAEAD